MSRLFSPAAFLLSALCLSACGSQAFVLPVTEVTPLLDICVGRRDDDCQRRMAFAKSRIDSTVSITSASYTASDGAGTYGGTGFVIGGGYIVTAWHVVDDSPFIYVKFRNLNRFGQVSESSRGYPVTVVGHDKDHDLALLKMQEPDVDLPPPLPMRITGLKVGEAVWQFGKRSIWSWGEIVERNVEFGGSSGLIMTSAAVQHGDSGGPLIDQYGNVLGVAVLVNTSTRYGYFVPIAHVVKLIPRDKPCSP